MEKELNIAAILKDKPTKTKLWSPIFGECEIRHINDDIDDSVSVVATYSLSSYEFIKDGRLSEKGECMLFPSKKMRDWEKFAWKKGDVLASTNVICVFGGFKNDDYTKFNALNAICISPYDNKNEAICSTADFSKVESEKDLKNYLLNSQIIFGNIKLPACDIEQPKPEFKDGDIVVLEEGESYAKCVIIFKNNNPQVISNDIHYYALLNIERMQMGLDNCVYNRGNNRLATDSEKQQLFDALAKENKAWNPDTLQIEDLPKKCEFKAFDKVLVRDSKDEEWRPAFFWREHSNGCEYVILSGEIYNYCIPYNDSTKHLLGTTDEWKGGEG